MFVSPYLGLYQSVAHREIQVRSANRRASVWVDCGEPKPSLFLGVFCTISPSSSPQCCRYYETQTPFIKKEGRPPQKKKVMLKLIGTWELAAGKRGDWGGRGLRICSPSCLPILHLSLSYAGIGNTYDYPWFPSVCVEAVVTEKGLSSNWPCQRAAFADPYPLMLHTYWLYFWRLTVSYGVKIFPQTTALALDVYGHFLPCHSVLGSIVW